MRSTLCQLVGTERRSVNEKHKKIWTTKKRGKMKSNLEGCTLYFSEKIFPPQRVPTAAELGQFSCARVDPYDTGCNSLPILLDNQRQKFVREAVNEWRPEKIHWLSLSLLWNGTGAEGPGTSCSYVAALADTISLPDHCRWFSCRWNFLQCPQVPFSFENIGQTSRKNNTNLQLKNKF